MTQPDLFDIYAHRHVDRAADAREEVRRSRAQDPATSKAAATSVPEFAASHFALILLALRDHGPMTVSEISYCTKLAEQRINKRLPEMHRAELVVLVMDNLGYVATRRGANKRQQRVWRAV